MQVVFVHGVNTRDRGDGDHEKAVAARTDRLNRLAFGGGARICSPYWGQFGHDDEALKSMPVAKGGIEALGLFATGASARRPGTPLGADMDLRTLTAAFSVCAIHDASQTQGERERREVEDYWMAAAKFADMQPAPAWLSQANSLAEVAARLDSEVRAMGQLQALGGLASHVPASRLDDFLAGQARGWAAGLVAQFLGDALMFFARRDASKQVRSLVASAIVEAATAAASTRQPLVLIGHSMGGSVLHEILSDPDEVAKLEAALGSSLAVDLLLSVGTQIGLFAELNQFTPSRAGKSLAVACKHYWNVFDYADILAFLSGPTLPEVVDFEVSTGGGLFRSHNAYFENALFFSRLNGRLKDAGVIA